MVPTYDEPEQEEGPEALLQQLDAHIAGLPPEMQQVFEAGFKEYPKMPEVLSTLMPEAYEYFKTVQQALMQQPQGQAPQGAPQDSPMAGGAPASQPVGEPAQGPLMGGAQPAKATSALGIA
jgi:hypothetical protein